MRLTVGTDGVASRTIATGEPSPSLRWCVEGAFARVKFPTGPDRLDVEVDLGWSAGTLTLAPRVVRKRPATTRTVDRQ